MSILDVFGFEMSVDATFYTRTVTMTNGRQVYAYSSAGTCKAFFYELSASNGYVADKNKPIATGQLIIRKSDASIATDNGRVSIGGKLYDIIRVDNVARQNDVVQIAIKELGRGE